SWRPPLVHETSQRTVRSMRTDTSDLLNARKPRCEMGPCPPLQRAANCVGAAQPNNTFCILPRLHIRRAISHASPMATTRAPRSGTHRFGHAREAVHSSDSVKGAKI